MKKPYAFFLFLLCAQLVMANTDLTGHFRFDVSSRLFPVENIEQHFAEYLDLPDNTTFTLTRDEVDSEGYRHLSFQQHINDTIEVKGGLVLVHALNGKVQTINGEVQTRSQYEATQKGGQTISARQALRKVGKFLAHESEAKVVWVKVLEKGQYVYHKAYEIMSPDRMRMEYVDIHTGDVVLSKSLVYSIDVQGKASTMYSGVRSFTVSQHADGLYYLEDEGRGIYTYDATYADTLHYSVDDLNLIMEDYRKTCAPISNPTTEWNLTWQRCLDRVYLDSIVCLMQHEVLPSLSLRITDSSDSLLYQTPYTAVGDTLPLILPIPMGVATKDGEFRYYLTTPATDGKDSLLLSFNSVVAYHNGWSPARKQVEIKFGAHFVDVGLQPALDVHWGMQQSIDFYRNVMHRNNHDNKGGIVIQYYNTQQDEKLFHTMPMNAAAAGGYTDIDFMIYGSGALIHGNVQSMLPVVSLDVMSHEYSHLITTHNGNGGLTYLDESGALNESFSDLMAMGVVQYTNGTCDWQIGADVMAEAPNMRSMSDPHQSGDGPQPKYYYGQYWAQLGDYSKTGDQGGVHTNSGVQNYWFYLLSEGGSGVNEGNRSYDVTGIGLDKAIRIAYLNQIYYLSPNAAYVDSRWGTEQAAKELYGGDSQEYRSVVAAWEAVGVPGSLAPTAIQEMEAQKCVKSTKYLRNGRLVIIRDGKTYNALGMEL